MRRVVIVAMVLIGLHLPMGEHAVAHESVCPFTQGLLHFSWGLTDFPIGAPMTASFAMSGVVVPCVNTNDVFESPWATGRITGWCNLAYGYGVTNRGHAFSFTVEPNRMVLMGELSGYGAFVEDPLDSGSCFNGTGTRFFLTGTYAMAHDVPVPTPPLDTACASTSEVC